jgi:hypothetical protein
MLFLKISKGVPGRRWVLVFMYFGDFKQGRISSFTISPTGPYETPRRTGTPCSSLAQVKLVEPGFLFYVDS